MITLLRGLSEGGYLGSLLYPLVPDDLARQLASLQPGPPMQLPATPALAGRDPTGCSVVTQLHALDAAAAWRIPLFLHADDFAIPAIPASTVPDAQCALDLAETWAKHSEQEYNYTQRKTVVLCLVGAWGVDACVEPPLTLNRQALRRTSTHRWLGGVWAENLNFQPDLPNGIGAMWAAVQSVFAQAHSRSLPLHLLGEMAAAKCKGSLLHAPLLSMFVEDADEQVLRA